MSKKRIPYVLLVLAVGLLLATTVGSTRAALTYYSENYVAEITVSRIGVSLLENGQVVSSRDYGKKGWKVASNRGDDSTTGILLTNMLKEDETLVLNKWYDEKLTVKNSGIIDTYVRVRVYRYWTMDGRKLTNLSPQLIDLNFVNTGKWVQNPNQTAECTELFYKGILPAGQETEAFADALRIDGEVASGATVETRGNVVTTTYQYDGVQFHVDVEVDAVQTHNAQDAIKSAWGVEASELGIL